MKTKTTLASLLFSIVFLTACSGGYSSHCDGEAGELHRSLATKDPEKALEIASSSHLDAEATCSAHQIPALAEAARLGYTAVVVQLLEKGAAIDKPDINGNTALIWAAQKGHLPVVQHLLQRGADIEKQNRSGRTALILAASNGHLSVVQHLLQRGADIEKPTNNGMTALIWAAWNGHLSVVQHLLQRGADIDKQNKYGYTALMLAARNGHLPIVQLLLKQGADIDKQDNYGMTALMEAIRSDDAKGNIPLFKALIDTPQNFHLTNKKGQTALEIAEERFKKAAPADRKFYSLIIAMLKQKMRP